ncbi:MAG: hypothetical protein AABW93_00115, partial [Nanoarchaeota archaeon]
RRAFLKKMGLLFEHSENQKYHIYRQRNVVLFSYVVFGIGSLIAFYYTWKFTRNVPVSLFLLSIFVFIAFETIIEYAIQAPKKWKAIASGKKVIHEGFDFAGNLVIKIEK